MLLAFDIGNTSVKAGAFEGDALVWTRRLSAPSTDVGRLGGEAEALVREVGAERVGVASVVPAAAGAVAAAVRAVTGAEPGFVHAGLPLPFELCYETPQTLGADRLAAAAAGWVRFGAGQEPPRSVVVVDAGTAITYEVIRAPGQYLGGLIAPGPALLVDALAGGTAQLPAVPLEMPEEVIGRSTREAIQAGVMESFVYGVRGVLSRIEERLGARPTVVCTGGWSSLLAERLSEIDRVEPDLVLYGVGVVLGGVEG